MPGTLIIFEASPIIYRLLIYGTWQKDISVLYVISGSSVCASDPCNSANGGLCQQVNNGAAYTCLCKPGFTRIEGAGEFLRCEGR